MRIISGTAKGTKLYSLEGTITRPTQDRVKEAIFNILQNQIRESIFLDLFAGSGAIGLEAASRGAKKVYLCEINKNAINIIKKNIEKTHLEKNIILYQLTFSIELIQINSHRQQNISPVIMLHHKRHLPVHLVLLHRIFQMFRKCIH